MDRLLTRLFAVSVFLCLSISAQATPVFMGLGGLPGSGSGFNSVAYAISADGSTVVGKSGEAFFWTEATGMVGIGDFPGGNDSSQALGVSGDGFVLVGSGLPPDDKSQALVWTSGTGLIGLGDLTGGDFHSLARGVSADGTVVVGEGLSGLGGEAFRWTLGTGMVGLSSLSVSDFFSSAMAISADGTVIVGRTSVPSGGTQAMRWTEATGMVSLGDLLGGGFTSAAYGISDDGSTIVGSSESSTPSGQEAFIWTESRGMVGLGEGTTAAWDVSADGSIVVGNAILSGVGQPFVWDALNGIQSIQDVLTNDFGLDLSGWQLGEANGISADGSVVVGFGANPDGITEGWIARLDRPIVSGCPSWICPSGMNSGWRVVIRSLVCPDNNSTCPVDTNATSN